MCVSMWLSTIGNERRRRFSAPRCIVPLNIRLYNEYIVATQIYILCPSIDTYLLAGNFPRARAHYFQIDLLLPRNKYDDARAREFSFFLNETLFLILQFFSPLALYACSNDVLARNGIA